MAADEGDDGGLGVVAVVRVSGDDLDLIRTWEVTHFLRASHQNAHTVPAPDELALAGRGRR